MIIPLRGPALGRKIGRGGAPPGRSIDRRRMTIMKWEMPEAVDFRFGMEITMYVANR
jgi:coenzyme PQQ precursor peptide PqqA